MKLGISSYTFTWAIGVKNHYPKTRINEIDLLNHARNLDIKLVQIADNMPLHKMPFEQRNNLSRKAMGFDIQGCPFGQGILPLEKMLSVLPENCRTAILEQWTPPENTIEETIDKELDWAKKSVEYLRKHFD